MTVGDAPDRAHHQGDGVNGDALSCTDCGYEATDADDLRGHLRDKDEDGRMSDCALCGRAVRASMLNERLACDVCEPPAVAFQCPKCGSECLTAIIATSWSLEADGSLTADSTTLHMERIASEGVSLIRCDNCDHDATEWAAFRHVIVSEGDKHE